MTKIISVKDAQKLLNKNKFSRKRAKGKTIEDYYKMIKVSIELMNKQKYVSMEQYYNAIIKFCAKKGISKCPLGEVKCRCQVSVRQCECKIEISEMTKTAVNSLEVLGYSVLMRGYLDTVKKHSSYGEVEYHHDNFYLFVFIPNKQK